jgi:hypothetical protein
MKLKPQTKCEAVSVAILAPHICRAVNWRACVTKLLSMAFSISFLRLFVVHISPTRTMELNSHLPRVEGIHTYDGVLPASPIGLPCDTVITSVPCRIRHDAPHLVFGGPEPCLLFSSLATRTPGVGFCRGDIFNIWHNCKRFVKLLHSPVRTLKTWFALCREERIQLRLS